MGFEFVGTIDGSQPIILKMPVAAGNTVAVGTMVSTASGAVAVSVTNDTAIMGVAISAGGAEETVAVIMNPNAIYKVTDANARVAGAALDLATGARGVASATNTDLRVYANSSATQETFVVIATGEHYLR